MSSPGMFSYYYVTASDIFYTTGFYKSKSYLPLAFYFAGKESVSFQIFWRRDPVILSILLLSFMTKVIYHEKFPDFFTNITSVLLKTVIEFLPPLVSISCLGVVIRLCVSLLSLTTLYPPICTKPNNCTSFKLMCFILGKLLEIQCTKLRESIPMLLNQLSNVSVPRW